MAQRIGPPFLEERARAALEKMAGDAPVAATASAIRAAYPDGLTEREVQVLRLIATGKSNKEIADALFISPKTVNTHVQHIFEKIDVANRAEATAYAFRNSLIGA